MENKNIELSTLTTEIKIKNIDEVTEKLEKIKSLICEISDLSKNLFK